MFDNFTVADGQDTAAWTTKSRVGLLEASKRLLERVQQDRDYIGYDYQVGFTAEGRRRHSGRDLACASSGGMASFGCILARFTWIFMNAGLTGNSMW